jgi:hypothetical protein
MHALSFHSLAFLGQATLPAASLPYSRMISVNHKTSDYETN